MICTSPNVVKYVSINIHFIQDDYGANNFAKNHDGQGNPNYTGYDRAEDLVNSMNAHLNQNLQMRLPCGNNTPVNPVRIQYVLKGVYFHQSTTYANEGVYGFSVHSAYAINPNTEINIYHINNPNIFHPSVGSPDGVAPLGPSNNLRLKIWKDYAAYLNNGGGVWYTAKVLNHEVAHNLNLRHAWGESGIDDGCTDTPFNNNCWNVNFPIGNPSCSTLCQVSNNMMDYNYSQAAISPCQINRMQNHLDGPANSYVYSCNGCMPTHSFFYLPESVCIQTEGKITQDPVIYLDGRGSWKEDDYEIEIYQVSSVGSGTQVGNTYHKVSFAGEIGKVNLMSFYNFQPGNIYQVRLITHNDCGSHTSIGWITIEGGDCLEEPVEPPVVIQPPIDPRVYLPSIPVPVEIPATVSLNSEDNTGNSDDNIEQPTTITIVPNPAKDMVEVTYQVIANSDYQLSLVSIFGEQLQILEQGNSTIHEKRNLRFDSSIYPSGVYVIVLTTDEGKQAKQLIIAK